MRGTLKKWLDRLVVVTYMTNTTVPFLLAINAPFGPQSNTGTKTYVLFHTTFSNYYTHRHIQLI